LRKHVSGSENALGIAKALFGKVSKTQVAEKRSFVFAKGAQANKTILRYCAQAVPESSDRFEIWHRIKGRAWEGDTDRSPCPSSPR